MFMESISQDKDHFRADLSIFIIRLIQYLYHRIVLLGESGYIVENPMSIIVSGVKSLWTPYLVYIRRVKDAIKGYPLQAHVFEKVRAMPFMTPAKV